MQEKNLLKQFIIGSIEKEGKVSISEVYRLFTRKGEREINEMMRVIRQDLDLQIVEELERIGPVLIFKSFIYPSKS